MRSNDYEKLRASAVVGQNGAPAVYVVPGVSPRDVVTSITDLTLFADVPLVVGGVPIWSTTTANQINITGNFVGSNLLILWADRDVG